MSAQDVNLFTELGSDATALTLEEIKVLDFYQQKPTTNSVKLVRVAENFSSSNELRFRPIGQELQRTGRKSSVTIEDASITNVWVGNLEETNGGGHLILFNTPLGTMGSMIYGDKTVELFPLRPDISVYVESNNDTNPIRDCPDIDESIASAASTLLCEEASNCETTVDVLVLIHSNTTTILPYYVSLTTKGPNSTVTPYPMKAAVKQKIQVEIARTNLAFLNSDIKNKKLRLVGVEYINMPLSSDIKDDRDMIKIYPQAQQYRIASRADIVVLITNQNYSGINGAAQQFPYTSSQAYAIVQASTIGGSRYTFSHEVGHLLGADHDNSGGIVTSGCAHGHYLVDGRGTILAGANTRILHYSNPEVSITGGATGTSENDNARKIKNSACFVGTFSDSPNNNTFSLILGSENIICNSMGKYTAFSTSYPTASNFSYSWDYSSDINFITPLPLPMSTKEITIGNLLKPTFFLRVKIYDPTGSLHATVIKKISVIQPCPGPPSTTLTSIGLFPNPAAEELTLSYNASEDSNFEINIFSLEGSRMYNATLRVVRGLGNYSLDVNDIPSGSYYMRLVSAKETIILPFIKE